MQIFMSKRDAGPNMHLGNEGKLHTSFKFILATSIYHVIYSNKLLDAEYDKEFEFLREFINNLNLDIRISVFEDIVIKNDEIIFQKELSVI